MVINIFHNFALSWHLIWKTQELFLNLRVDCLLIIEKNKKVGLDFNIRARTVSTNINHFVFKKLTRTINIIDSTEPTISLNGPSYYYLLIDSISNYDLSYDINVVGGFNISDNYDNNW